MYKFSTVFFFLAELRFLMMIGVFQGLVMWMVSGGMEGWKDGMEVLGEEVEGIPRGGDVQQDSVILSLSLCLSHFFSHFLSFLLHVYA